MTAAHPRRHLPPALFYTLVPGFPAHRPVQLLCVTRVTHRIFRGHLLDGSPESVRACYCLGHFATIVEARLVQHQVRIVHAAHRLRARPLEAELAALERHRDAELRALIDRRSADPQENSHAA